MKKRLRIFFALSVTLNLTLLLTFFYYVYKDRVRKEYFSFDKYREINKQLSVDDNIRAVFIGNSITENWMNIDPDFFIENGFLCRGIGGQTSSQLLLRFRQDVVELCPKVVVINAGTNDIGQGDGFYDVDFTFDNIKSMSDIAKANNICVVLTSVLPAKAYMVSRLETITDVESKIAFLNQKIKNYASVDSLCYVDYYKDLSDFDSGLKKEYTFDGVHPNKEGYVIMERLIVPLIDSIIYKMR